MDEAEQKNEVVRRARSKRSFLFELLGFAVETSFIGGALVMLTDLPQGVLIFTTVFLGVVGLTMVRVAEYWFHRWHTVPIEMARERDQDIAKGVYTLRYGQQPVDGNHEGTSPTRDFLTLVNAEKDTSAKPMELKALLKASAEAAGSSHPALFGMQKVKGDAKAELSIRHEDRHD